MNKLPLLLQAKDSKSLENLINTLFNNPDLIITPEYEIQRKLFIEKYFGSNYRNTMNLINEILYKLI